jgi:hypothetical protein
LLSAGPLIFTGAGFASIEGVVVLARLLAGYEFTAIAPPRAIGAFYCPRARRNLVVGFQAIRGQNNGFGNSWPKNSKV